MNNDLEENLIQNTLTTQKKIYNKTCCFYMNTHPLKISLFFIQVFLTIGLMSFSLYQISIIKEEDKSVYFSIVSGLVGYWLPSPKSKLKLKN